MHSEELHKLYSSPSVAWMVISKRMRWAGHVTCMGKVRNVYKILDEKLEGKRPLRRSGHRWDVDWILPAQDRDW